jgi:uncharacterized protein (TIGR03083 family)
VQPSELYRATRGRIAALVADLDDTALDTVVPATPQWRVRDVVAHCVGVPADVAAGRIDGAGTDPWTAQQVAVRSGRSATELVAEWGEVAPGVEALMDSVPQLGRIVFDVLAHEQDLRGALGQPGCDAAALAEFTQGAVETVTGAAEAAGFSLRVQIAGSDIASGPEDAPLKVVAPSGFELFRAILGRRSTDQVAAWDWSGDPTALLAGGFFLFGPRPTPLVEADPLSAA